ncbi:MAG: hypothetical protein ACI4TK_13810, partial [Agathobacter sp.]
AATLFSDDAVLELPQKKQNVQKEEMAYFFQTLHSASPTIYLVNSPQIIKDDEKASGSFFINAYYLNRDDKTATLGGSRFDLHFCLEAGIPKIQKCIWYDMLKLLPEPYVAIQEGTLWKQMFQSGGQCPSDDECFILTQMLSEEMYLRVQEETPHMSMLFNVALKKLKKDVEVCYITLDLCESATEQALQFSLSFHRDRFQKSDNSGWVHIHGNTDFLLDLGAMSNSSLNPPDAEEMIKQNRGQHIPLKISSPEVKDVLCVENIAAEWVSAIRTGNAYVFYETCLQKDAEDLMVHVIRPVSGMEGFAEQCRLMIIMDKLQPKKQGNHILSTPLIHQESEDEITGFWLDFGWTMFAGAFGISEEPNPVLPAIGRYIMKFRKTSEGWKVFSLQWGPLAQSGCWRFCREKAGGWASTPIMRRWPSLQQSYIEYDDDGINEYSANPMEAFL